MGKLPIEERKKNVADGEPSNFDDLLFWDQKIALYWAELARKVRRRYVVPLVIGGFAAAILAYFDEKLPPWVSTTLWILVLLWIAAPLWVYLKQYGYGYDSDPTNNDEK